MYEYYVLLGINLGTAKWEKFTMQQSWKGQQEAFKHNL